jgi:imidazolonepropionase-like amidohydrolase
MASTWMLIRNGNVIDGTGRRPVPGASVLIHDNRIEQIGTGADLNAVPRDEREETQVIEANGRTVMPGLIDTHCHISYGESRAQEEQDLYTSVEARTLHAAWNAKKMLRAGVTGISAPGGSYYIGVGIREAIRAGFVEGPRTTAAGRYITTSNGLTDWYPETVGVPDGSIGFLANTLPEMMAAIRKQVKAGVDLIKLSDSPFGQFQAFTGDELKAVADLAHQLRRKITIHAVGSAEVDAAIAARFDWIMHGHFMTDEVIGRLAESRIPLIPTLTLLANWADFGHLVNAVDRDSFRRVLDTAAITLHKAHKAGVKLLAGTDTGFSLTPYGEWHARELELLMEYAGLSALEAITSATKDAAHVLGLDGEIGELAPGKLADVIVVDGDPTQNIRVLQDKHRIVAVIKDGRQIHFNDEVEGRRWPVDRSQLMTTADLTYNMVYNGEAVTKAEGPSWTDEEKICLTKGIRSAEVAAREPAD